VVAFVICFGAVASAYMDFPFSFTIARPCVRPGEVQTITVPLGRGPSVVHIVVTYPDGTRSHNVTGGTDPENKFAYAWTVESSAPAGLATLWITVLLPNEDTAIAHDYHFAIGKAGQPCDPPPDEGLHHGQWIMGIAAPTEIKKVCDAGVSGTAAFQLSVVLPPMAGSNYSDAFTLPESSNLSLPCNGAAVPLPRLAFGITVTLHEVRLPAGAAQSADTRVLMINSTGTQVPIVSIRNARATAVLASAPPRLPPTGGGMQRDATLWWLPLAVGAVALSTAGWIIARGRAHW
jgi:hypothetical protein